MGKTVFFFCLALLLGWPGQKLTVSAFDLYQKGKASESWVAVTANIDSFELKSARTKGGASGSRNSSTTYVEVLYNYEYDGLTYSGDRTGFGPYSKGQLKRPRRGKADVYVNPNKPSESVYIKGVSKPNFGALAVGIGLVLAGLCFVFLAIRSLIDR